MLSRHCVAIIRITLAAVFGFAAVTKLISSEALVSVLHYVMPAGSLAGERDLIMVGVITSLEGGMALAIVLFPHSRAVTIVAAVVLSVYTVVLALLAADPRAPSCACLGSIGGGARANFAGIVRNAGLLGAVGALCFSPRAVPMQRAASSPNSPVAPRARAFSLVELLAVIAVIAVLLALVLPGLLGSRKQAQLLRRTSTLRGLASALSTYADTNRGQLPYMGVSGNPYAPLQVRGQVLPPTIAYFQQAFYYASQLVPEHFDDRASLVAPDMGQRPEEVFVTHFWLTQTAFAAPSYFSEGPTPEPLSLYRPVRLVEAQYPSAKVLVLDSKGAGYASPDSLLYLERAVLSAQADGSAGTHSADILNHSNWSQRPFSAMPFIGMTTRFGIAGRDF